MPARKTDKGIVYLRRSDSQQELSFQSQLQWAIAEAGKLGIALNVSIEDVEEARRNGKSTFKAVRIDDAITGADLSRPGLRALIDDAIADSSISHVFVYRRDRLGRPEDPLESMLIERQIRRAGVTIVTSEGIARPLEPGERDLAGDITHLVAYYESRQWLESHAERIIVAQQQLARQGYSTGRRASYGFARYLVGPDGKVIEKLERGRRVRQRGCHVVILPDNDQPEKLAVRKLMLDLRRDGWGWKRIAHHLDAMGIPSPAAGETRTDNGVRHRVSGRWCPNTVASLCRDPLVVGIMEYGRRAEGALRRHSPNGPRCLSAADRNEAGGKRLRFNADSECIRTRVPGGSAVVYDPAHWREIQNQVAARGADQRGVPRARDPGKFPLRLLLVDLTDGCGYPMYGRVHGRRSINVCGRYWRTAGHECENNAIDAEAALRFALKTLRQIIWQHGDAPKLEALLRGRARRRMQSDGYERTSTIIAQLEARAESLSDELATVQHRMAREKDDLLYSVLTDEFRRIKADAAEVERDLAEYRKLSQAREAADPEVEVEAAMAFLHSLERAASDPQARAEVNQLLRALGIMIGLTFTRAIKGRQRVVRRVVSGVMVFGNHPLPVPLYGRDNAQVALGPAGRVSDGTVSKRRERGVRKEELKPPANQEGPQGGPAGRHCSGEGNSFQEVHRGDWI